MAGNMNTTTLDAFIPEQWSDEIIAAHKNLLVVEPRVRVISALGKHRGDTLHIPVPGRGTASAKVEGTKVTRQQDTAVSRDFTISKVYEYSQFVEDYANTLSMSSHRSFYADDAAYALTKQTETDILSGAATFQSGTAYDAAVIGSDGSTAWDGSASSDAGNGADMTDAGLRKMIQTLEELGVPGGNNRWTLFVPPSQKNVLSGIARFSSSDYVDNKVVANGQFTSVYGIPVLLSNNLATITADDTTTDYKACIMMHRDALAYLPTMKIRSQKDYLVEELGTLYVSDTVYGVGTYRPENGLVAVVPA